MTVIGLTGGIASGKSTAAGWMKDLGAVVIDADRLGHRVYEPGTSGFQAVVNEFGHDLVQADGTINRQLLGGRVFGDPDQMKRLTDIVWPEIRRLAKQEVTELKRRDRNTPIVLEAAVLVEANWFDLVDEVWVVTVDPAIARSRLMARNGLTEAQAQARIDSQISNKERAQLAYVKIDNSSTLDEFHQAVDREWKKLARRAGFTVATPPAPAASAAPAKRVASKATTSVASKPAAAKAAPAKAAATASKAGGTKAAPARATAAKLPPVARATSKAAPVRSAPAKAAPAKASPVRAGAVKAAPARATATRSASTQSASTRTTSARPAAARPAPARPVARASAPRAAAAPAARTASRATATAVKRTAVKPAATRSTATRSTATRSTATKPPATRSTATKPAAKPAARPVAGRRTGTK